MKLNANDYLSQYKLDTILNIILSINIDSNVDVCHNRTLLLLVSTRSCVLMETLLICVHVGLTNLHDVYKEAHMSPSWFIFLTVSSLYLSHYNHARSKVKSSYRIKVY